MIVPMFDLIQKYKPAFYVVFVISAVGLVLTMFAGSQGGGSSLIGSGTIAKVEGETISTQELVRSFQYRRQEVSDMIEKQLEGQNQNKDQMRQYLTSLMGARVTPENVLSEVIQQKFLLTTAQSLGFKSSPEMIKDVIFNSPDFQKDGQFDPLLYKERVARPGLYEKEIGKRAIMMRLGQLFNTSLGFYSTAQREDEQSLLVEKYFRLLSVPLKGFQNPKSVSSAEVQDFLKNPESESALKSYFEKNSSRFKKPEEVKARHILLQGSDAKAKATQITQDIKDKKITFEAAALQFSTDKSNSSKGGDLGFFGRGVMDPAFEKAAFALKAGELTEAPVQSSFGFHIIETTDRKNAEEKTLEQVKNEIAPQVLLEKLQSENAKNWIHKITSQAIEPTETELKNLNLKWTDPQKWSPLEDRLGPVSQLSPENLSGLVSLNSKNKIMKTTLTSGDSIYIVQWTDTPKKAPSSKNPMMPNDDSPRIVSDEEKAEEAYRFYLAKRYENLEKSKKIYKSEKILAELNQAVAPQAEGR
jgi:parvulin-like peptidyl-prolyl isomerase